MEEALDVKQDSEAEEVAAGGLDQDDEFLTLKSGGQSPESFEISKNSAMLSKFVTTILEGTAAIVSVHCA